MKKRVIYVLIVDDDIKWFKNILDSLSPLEEYILNYYYCSSPISATKEIDKRGKKNSFDLVFIDLDFGGKDRKEGRILIRALQQKEWMKKKHFFVISGTAIKDDIPELTSLKIEETLLKDNIKPEALREKIRKLFKAKTGSTITFFKLIIVIELFLILLAIYYHFKPVNLLIKNIFYWAAGIGAVFALVKIIINGTLKRNSDR